MAAGVIECNGPEFHGVGPSSKHSLSISCSFPWVLNDQVYFLTLSCRISLVRYEFYCTKPRSVGCRV